MVGVELGVAVEVTEEVGVTVPVVVFVGVTEAVPVADPTLTTTVRVVPNVWPFSLDWRHVPVTFPTFDGATKATDISANSPGLTALPMAVAFPLMPSPEMKTI
jgi:hypothetical protein